MHQNVLWNFYPKLWCFLRSFKYIYNIIIKWLFATNAFSSPQQWLYHHDQWTAEKPWVQSVLYLPFYVSLNLTLLQIWHWIVFFVENKRNLKFEFLCAIWHILRCHCKKELEIIKFIRKLVISLIIWCPWRSTGGG